MAQASKTFRLFVSSTFSDLKEERNALQQYVFPRLRELCMQHGCRFQAIDLRWGVSEEASRDQQTMKICLEEIKRCQRVTPRPNFLVLLGDRYGWRPLPAGIPADEFEDIVKSVTDPSDKALLVWEEQQQPDQKGWYRRDDNARSATTPAVYCLQPRGRQYANYSQWEVIEQRLRAILVRATAGMTLAPEALAKYTTSATEQELMLGAMKTQDAPEHVYCFFRGIQTQRGLPIAEDLLPDEAVKDFVYLDGSGGLDTDAHNRLEKLKEQLRKLLPDNLHEYEAHWNGTGITTDHVGRLPVKLEDCLQLLEDENAPKTLCVDVWRRLARVILDEVKKMKIVDPLDKEIEDHQKFGKERHQQFIGCEVVLEHIRHYLSDNNNKPLVIYGESGSGKTALMAKALAECESPNIKPIFRFIGATPSSSEIRSLLESLCNQIGKQFDERRATPSEYQELVTDFRIRLALAETDRPLIIFLDALDQLGSANNAHSLNWLPRKLPPHAKLIVSVLEAEGTTGECLASAQKALPLDSFVRIGPLSAEHGEQLLDAWLKESGRTLEVKQRQGVLRQFANCPLPLYLKLAFNEAKVWKSYDPPLHLSDDIPGILNNLFTRLEKEVSHGHLFVSRSLGYLSAARHGLTDDEMVAVLSADQEVLKDFHRRSPNSPEMDALPVVIWSQLYFDLEPYLTERRADNTALLSFYHRQLGEVVAGRYLRGEAERVIRTNLADFFESQFPGQRRVSELPWQLVKIESWQRLNTLLSDLPFFEAAWNSSESDVEAYWAKVENNSSFRLLEAYRPMVDAPERYSESLIWGVAALLAETGHPLESLSLRRYLVDHYHQTHNPGQLSEALGNLSVSLHLAGELDEALKLLKLQEDICRRLNHLEGLANCLGNQAQILHTRGLLAEAMVKVKEQERLCNQLKDRGGLCRAYSTQGLILHSQGKLDEALALFQREEEIAKEIGDIKQLSISFGNQARIYMLRGE